MSKIFAEMIPCLLSESFTSDARSRRAFDCWVDVGVGVPCRFGSFGSPGTRIGAGWTRSTRVGSWGRWRRGRSCSSASACQISLSPARSKEVRVSLHVAKFVFVLCKQVQNSLKERDEVFRVSLHIAKLQMFTKVLVCEEKSFKLVISQVIQQVGRMNVTANGAETTEGQSLKISYSYWYRPKGCAVWFFELRVHVGVKFLDSD